MKRQIRPNAAFRNAGLLTVQDGKVTKTEAYSVPEGGTAMIYLTVPDPTGAGLKRVRQALEGLEGIDRVIEPAEFASLGLPRPEDDGQMAALFLTAKEGYAFTADPNDPSIVDAPAGSLGAHGYIATDPDLRALFIASGRGIKRGLTLDAVDNVDVAPTAARLLGLDLKNVDGRVLTEILSEVR